MALRLPAFAPRIVLIAVPALLATAALTYAADQQIGSTPAAPAAAAAPVKPAVIVVPDVRHQAFVFAKGALQDAGLAWRVAPGVQGYAANVVVGQSPAAGTHVYDTGAPLVKVTLSRNKKYPENGDPEDVSPYRATAVELADAPKAVATVAPATTTPAATTPAATTAAVTTTAASAPAAKPAVTPTAKPAAKPKVAPKSKYPQNRPAAFAVAGAPKEPLKEMPLPDRASALGAWVASNPKPTNANVRHWLYQNDWIVTGAKFGWWRGAEALRTLIAADRRTESTWGIGSKSRSLAEAALSEVEARSR